MEKKHTTRIERDAARQMLFDLAPEPETESAPLLESYGRVLAEDVIADENVPPFAKSPLDGYAFRSADTAGASRETPAALRVMVDAGGNGAISSLLGCDLIADLPPGTPPLPAGTVVDAYRI